MLTRCTHFAMSLTVVAAVLVSSGCIGSPTNGDSVTGFNDTFDFLGATPFPAETIEIQAWNGGLDGDWETIAEARTSSSALIVDGERWYTWRSPTVKIPWAGKNDQFWMETSKPGYDYLVEVRAVGSKTGVLGTFKQGFVPFDFLYGDFIDVWNKSYHGENMVLYMDE